MVKEICLLYGSLAGADPEFLDSGFKFTKGVRFVNCTRLCDIFLKILYVNGIILSRGGGGGGGWFAGFEQTP